MNAGTTDGADVCIIGAGPAGAILAHALAERNHDVVVLEAGRRFDFEERTTRMERHLRPEHDQLSVWDMGGPRDRYTSSGDYDYHLNWSRVKGVGGTTLHWGAMTPRLHPEDFEMRSRHGVGRDWPISYDDVEPYYLQAERALGVAGEPGQFAGPRSGPYPLEPLEPSYSDRLLAEACDSLGIELDRVPRAINTEPYDGRSQCVGFGTCSPVCPSGAKYDATVHVRKAEAEGARILDRAPVQRLVHGDDGEEIVEAIYIGPAGETHRQRADYFVVACGAVESIRLLLLSSSPQYPDGLANSSGVLGRYFMEHPAVRVRGELAQPTQQHLIGYETSMSEQFYDHDSGPEGSMLLTLSNTAGPTPLEIALDQSADVGRLLNGDVLAPFEGDQWGDDLVETVEAASNNHLAVNAWAEQRPHRENQVSLDQSKTDAQGKPVPDISLTFHEPVRSTLRAACDIIKDILEERGATDLTTVHSPDTPFVVYHHMGGTRMGTDPQASVVNPDLRTHDLHNCYVSSSSAFVTAGAANPTLTIVALTLRLADHLHDRLTDR